MVLSVNDLPVAHVLVLFQFIELDRVREVSLESQALPQAATDANHLSLTLE